MLITLDLSKWAISEMTITELDGTQTLENDELKHFFNEGNLITSIIEDEFEEDEEIKQLQQKQKQFFHRTDLKLVFPNLMLTFPDDKLFIPTNRLGELDVSKSLLPLTSVRFAIAPRDRSLYFFMGKITEYSEEKLVFHTFNYWFRKFALGIADYDIGEKIIELRPATLKTWNKYKNNFITINKEFEEASEEWAILKGIEVEVFRRWQRSIPTFNNDGEMQNWFWSHQALDMFFTNEKVTLEI